MSLVCKILMPTVVKQSTLPSSRLGDEHKGNLPAGEYEIIKWEQVEGNHFRVSFKKPIAAISGRNYQTWLLWGDVCRFLKEGEPDNSYKEAKNGVDLDVPYFAQVEIKGEPTFKSKWEQNRTCFTSAMAMVLKYRGANIKGDDDYYRIVQRYGDTTSWNAQISSAKYLGYTCHQRTDADFGDIVDSLLKDKPVVAGILHRGAADYPSGGHMIVVRGVTSRGDWIVNDSYGSILDNYSGAVENGNKVIYPQSIMKKRWTVEGPRSGWAMFF